MSKKITKKTPRKKAPVTTVDMLKDHCKDLKVTFETTADGSTKIIGKKILFYLKDGKRVNHITGWNQLESKTAQIRTVKELDDTVELIKKHQRETE